MLVNKLFVIQILGVVWQDSHGGRLRLFDIKRVDTSRTGFLQVELGFVLSFEVFLPIILFLLFCLVVVGYPHSNSHLNLVLD